MSLDVPEEMPEVGQVFTDSKFAEFRRRSGLTYARQMGDAIFGADKLASENILVTAHTDSRTSRRSDAHKVRNPLVSFGFGIQT